MNTILCVAICVISAVLVTSRERPTFSNRDQDHYIYYPSWNHFSWPKFLKSTTKVPKWRPYEFERKQPPPPPPPKTDAPLFEAEVEKGEMNPTRCGRTRDLLTGPRVVGGRMAQKDEFPWQVALMSKMDPKLLGNYQHVCGATILNSRWIITAAHCTHGVELSKIKGIIGTNDIRSLEPNGKYVYFDHVVIHKGYQHGLYNNDISLLHTTKEMPILKNGMAINAACIKEGNFSHEGYLTVTGWGRISEEGPRTSRLRALEVPLQDGKPCKKAYDELWNDENMLCAGFVQGGRDSCQADSGGPLIFQEEDTSYLVGIVSFGNGCARRRNPGVYVNVSRYVQWIKDNMHI